MGIGGTSHGAAGIHANDRLEEDGNQRQYLPYLMGALEDGYQESELNW